MLSVLPRLPVAHIRARSLAKARTAPAAAAAVTGLTFPNNGDAVGNVQMRFSTPPDIKPLTLLWKINFTQHNSYYTTFFHGRTDGTFVGDQTYFGCHPYPDGGAGGSTHKFEISVEGVDDVTADNSQSSVVSYDTWYRQAAVAENTSGSVTTLRFWYDLADTTDKVIVHPTTSGPLVNATQSPMIVFGDASWSLGNERLGGTLRGIMIFDSALTQAQVVALSPLETDAAVLAECSSLGISAPWYLNINPTPDDVTDKSGNGNNPGWLNANRPTLYEG